MDKAQETPSKPQQPQQQQNEDSKPAASVSPSTPQFRSVAMAPRGTADLILPRPTSLAGGASFKTSVINKQDYQPRPPTIPSPTFSKESPWSPTELRPVPAFYPLERSSRLVEDNLEDVVSRVSEANRVLSIHAVYCNDTATAALFTPENVEMHLSLWKTMSEDRPGIAVELQRRKGDSIAFHRYSRYLLDAAVGDFDASAFGLGEDLDIVYSKSVHRLLTLDTTDSSTEVENAIIAIEIAHGLLMKDRMDARQLGLESLCLLTDPNKTGITTALIASRVVLLGTIQEMSSTPEDTLLFDDAPFQEIRQALLSLIQLRRIGDADEFEEPKSEEEEHITILHNLALAVLANALDVIENEDRLDAVPEETRKPKARADSAASVCESFLEEAEEVAGNREILKTLIKELGKATDKPHNAHLSAKCIGSLCRASDKARKRAKELGAKTVVQTALEVGTRTHLKLETECSKVMTTLQQVQTDAPATPNPPSAE